MTAKAAEPTPPELVRLYNNINEQIHTLLDTCVGSPDSQERTLEAEAETLKDTVNFVNKELQVAAVSQLRHRNSLAPLYRLPPEILVTIFTYSLSPMVHKRKYFRRLHCLAGVSYFWRNVILHHASFWANLSDQLPEQWIPTAIKHSSAHPLHIKIGYSRRNILRTEGFFSHVTPIMTRWKSLVVFIRDPLQLEQHLRQSAPNLEKLYIRLTQEPFRIIQIFNGGQTAHLRHLCLFQCPLDWTTPMFSGLLSLDMREIVFCRPSLDQLFAALQASPWLRSLVLHHIHFNEQLPDLGVVELPSLETVHLKNIHTGALQAIIEMINAPRCKSLQISAHTDSPYSLQTLRSEFFKASMVHWQPVICGMIASASEVAIRLANGKLEIKAISTTTISTQQHSQQAATEDMILVLDSSFALHSVSWIDDAMAPTGISSTIFLSIDGNCIKREEVKRLFSHVPSTTHLHIHNASNDIIDSLDEEIQEQHEKLYEVTWPLPNLLSVSLDVRSLLSLKPLEVVLDGRYGCSPILAIDGIEYKSILPKKLRKLVLQGWFTFTNAELFSFEEIRRIVGKENILDLMFDKYDPGARLRGGYKFA